MRPHHLTDFENCARMWANMAVTKHITGRPSTKAESWARHLRHIGHWKALGFGYWVVLDKESNAFLGEVGFGLFHRDMEPALGEYPEIGWVLSPTAHGRGLASETARAATLWGDTYFTVPKTVCIVAPEHTPSIRVAEKQGYKTVGTSVYMGGPTLILERDIARS
ncbi:MAG: GNAT family N-acetyltransferase [Hyphomicrobiales bacterium]